MTLLAPNKKAVGLIAQTDALIEALKGPGKNRTCEPLLNIIGKAGYATSNDGFARASRACDLGNYFA